MTRVNLYRNSFSGVKVPTMSTIYLLAQKQFKVFKNGPKEIEPKTTNGHITSPLRFKDI